MRWWGLDSPCVAPSTQPSLLRYEAPNSGHRQATGRMAGRTCAAAGRSMFIAAGHEGRAGEPPRARGCPRELTTRTVHLYRLGASRSDLPRGTPDPSSGGRSKPVRGAPATGQPTLGRRSVGAAHAIARGSRLRRPERAGISRPLQGPQYFQLASPEGRAVGHRPHSSKPGRPCGFSPDLWSDTELLGQWHHR